MSEELKKALVKAILKKLKLKMRLFSYIFPSIIFLHYMGEATITEIWKNVSHKATSRTLLNILNKTGLFNIRKEKEGRLTKIYLSLNEKGEQLARLLLEILE